MNVRAGRWLLVTFCVLAAVLGCSPGSPPPAPPSTPASKAPIDYVALQAEIEKAIRTGPATLDNVRAVLVNVDGETKIAHYRHGFTSDDYGHVFSVTKSVVSILVGIAIADGLIAGVDQPMANLLPKHRHAMNDETAQVTLRQLMTMSGGFDDYLPSGDQWEKAAEPGGNYVELLLERPQHEPGTAFWYSNPSAHLVAAVVAAALDGRMARTLGAFSSTPGRNSLSRWVSRPARFSPSLFPISLRPSSSRPALVGEPTPTASSSAGTGCG